MIVQDGSTGNGYTIKTWDRLVEAENTLINNSDLTFDYYGNTTGEFIDSDTQVRPFHSVPLLSGSQERGKNRNILADNLEGYDSPGTTSLTLSLPDAISLGFTTLHKHLFEVKHRKSSFVNMYAYSAWYVYLTEVVPVGYYAVTATEQTVTGSSTYPTLPTAPTTLAFSALTFRGGDLNTVVANTRPAGYTQTTEQSALLIFGLYLDITGISTDTYNVFLPQSLHKAGVVFGDQYMRKCGVAESESNINIPPRNYAFSVGYSAIDWSLATSSVLTEIPDWAYYYWVVKVIYKPYFIASFDDAPKYATKNLTTGLLEFTATSYATNVVAIAINANALL